MYVLIKASAQNTCFSDLLKFVVVLPLVINVAVNINYVWTSKMVVISITWHKGLPRLCYVSITCSYPNLCFH